MASLGCYELVREQADTKSTLPAPRPCRPTRPSPGTERSPVPSAGVYWLYLQALGTDANIAIDGKGLARTGAFQGGVHGDILQANQDNVVPTIDGLDNLRREVELTAGPHQITIKTTPTPPTLRFSCASTGTPPNSARPITRPPSQPPRSQSCGCLSLDPPVAGLRPSRRTEQAG